MLKCREQMKEMNGHPNTTLKTNLRCSLIIALCFLWTATGYLTWMYHLLDFTESSTVDWLTEAQQKLLFKEVRLYCLYRSRLCIY